MSRHADSAILNQALYDLRTAAGLSQKDVADRIIGLATSSGRSAVGISANTVSRWERGIVRPTPLYRRLLADMFKVPIDDLGFTVHRDEPATIRNLSETTTWTRAMMSSTRAFGRAGMHGDGLAAI
jgi:transcriptional regulator with XRE-family HTH domain